MGIAMRVKILYLMMAWSHPGKKVAKEGRVSEPRTPSRSSPTVSAVALAKEEGEKIEERLKFSERYALKILILNKSLSWLDL
jgi:hypothetical protein